MRPLVLILLLFSSAIISAGPQPLTTTPTLPSKLSPVQYRGIDASFILDYERAGAVFYTAQAQPTDALKAFAENGANLLRLRIFTNKPSGHGSVSDGLILAARAHRLGMDLLIDFHYSDSWADPGQQTIPAAWIGLTGTALQNAVTLHTFEVLQAFEAQGTPPAIVQIGNEVSNGMLWPLGSPWDSGWTAFANLLKAGIAGVDAAMPGPLRPLVLIHHDKGGDTNTTTWFYSNLVAQGVAFDVIGLSYYPWWHGSFSDMRRTTNALATRFQRPIMIVETAYPWTLGWADNTHNFVGLPAQLDPRFNATPAGQRQFLKAMTRTMERLPDELGLGWCYWAPEFVASPSIPTPWENLALFDFGHRLLPAAKAFGPPMPE